MSGFLGHFSLWGDFAVEDITRTLALQPSWTHRKGDVLKGSDEPAKTSTWDIHYPTGARLEQQLDFFFETLTPRRETLQALTKRFQAECNLAVSAEDGAQVLTLTPERLKELAALNVTVNLFLDETKNMEATG